MFGTLFGFNGRLSRAGFIEAVFSIVLIDVGLVLGQKYVEAYGLPGAAAAPSPLASALVTATPWVVAVFTLWGLLATGVKRCHDRGRPGILLLLALVPVAGWLWLLVDLWLLPGTKGKNRYGRAPHGHDEGQPILWGAPEPPVAVPVSADSAALAAHGSHDVHGHDAHAPAGEGHGAGAHAHESHAHEAHAHETHAHETHAHETHAHESHAHEAHAEHAHESHAHEAHAHEGPVAHGGEDHAHGDHGHEGHGHEAAHLEPVVAAETGHGHGAEPQAAHGAQEREVPAFVQRFATIYYDPTPPRPPARQPEPALAIAAETAHGPAEPLQIVAH